MLIADNLASSQTLTTSVPMRLPRPIALIAGVKFSIHLFLLQVAFRNQLILLNGVELLNVRFFASSRRDNLLSSLI